MRDYQTIKNPYRLPQTLYRRCLSLARDYERLKAERDSIIFSSVSSDGQPGAPGAGTPTEAKAMRILEIDADCNAVERALETVPKEYRRGVYSNVAFGAYQFTLNGASDRTWSRWRGRFMYYIAYFKHWI